MDRSAWIAERLREDLAADPVEVLDESHLHAGHAGAKSGGGHFKATIVSARFEGLSKVAAQRLVYQLLADEMRGDIHALSMSLFTPTQWQARG
jgi:BolA protein